MLIETVKMFGQRLRELAPHSQMKPELIIMKPRARLCYHPFSPYQVYGFSSVW